MTYLKFISNAFQRSLAYKLEYYTGLFNAFLYIFIFTSVWKTVAKESPNFLGGWKGEKLVEYAILSTLIKVSFGRNDSLVSNKIKTGDIVYDFLKPYNFVLMYFSDSVGVSLFQFFARAIPLLIFSIFFFGIVPDLNWISICKFIPIYIFSFILFTLFGFFISILSFFFTETFSFWILYSALVTLLSGSVIPVNLFPEGWLKFVSLTPFPYLYYFPTAILIQSPIQFTYQELFLNYIIQISVLFVIILVIYSFGKKKVEFAGG
ncbi:MAG: ABC-2 family transporter protein [Leptospiraceae bacterium]|nr:ABC-2 family transporter protein [Leptospiraceae bacterium]MCK6381943.1 ABC-2 family transporter protein [Leptospiraceae bacterium]NUM42089.1 ABC-2 family transporter protein [Leptospiraceae bacterium]